MTVSHWQSNYPPQRDTDLLIIGAGLAGCAAALMAKEEGLHVTVVDKADVALGASGRNAGFMISGLDTYYHHAVEKYGASVTREMWQLSQDTLAFWRSVVTKADGRVPMWNCGSMLLAESEAEAQDLEKAHRALQENGIEAEFFPYDPLKRGYYAAIRQPNDGAVHPLLLAQEMLSQSGADFVPNNELYALEQYADSVTAHTRLYTFRAKHVLLCTNAYSALVDDYFVGKVVPTRAQVLVTERLPAPVLETCGYSDYGYMYYRMTFDGRLLLGGARHHYKALEHDTTEDKLNALVQAKLDDYLKAHFPDVSAPVARRWAGIMGFSVDGLPLVGTLPNRPRIGFAVGFTGHGLAMAAGTIKRALARLLHGAPAGAVDVSRLV